MIKPNDIAHSISPPLDASGVKSTTFLHSTRKSHHDDTQSSRVSFGQQIPSTVSRGTSVNFADTSFVAATPSDEATAAFAPILRQVAVATIQSSCGGVEGHARHVRTTEQWLQDGGIQPNNLQLGTGAGIKPGPQDSIQEVGECGFSWEDIS